MHPLYSAAEIRSVEQAAKAGSPSPSLMRRAGAAAAEAALALLGERRSGARVLVLAGPGDNGGDALELAYLLAQEGLPVTVALHADPAKQSPDAAQALQRAQGSSVKFAAIGALGTLGELVQTPWSLAVDGLFGIGLARPIADPLTRIVEEVNALPCPILALDVPSGLDADTGDIVGPGVAVRATHTITFIGDKPGLHTCFGRDYAGQVQVASLDIDAASYPQPRSILNDAGLFHTALRPRAHNSHKGSFGNVAVIGGAHGTQGAAILCARAAAKCGAGRIYAGFPDTPPAYDGEQPELMCRLAADLDFGASALVVGPGLGSSREAHDLVARALHAGSPLVLDADALNLIAAEPGLQQKFAARKGWSLLTPHPLEAARLLDSTATQVQGDRLSAARELARKCNAIAVLKGSGTVIARPDGFIAVNTTGNPGLASGGTGDVLAGVCGALLAQGMATWEAALAAVWLHGRAADDLAAQGIGPIGMTASELIPAIRAALNRLVQGR
jgi:hydroxyethylthiazole kinase-like uncharacterized protein yjeF